MQVILEEARENYKADIMVELESNDADQLDANAAQVQPQHQSGADASMVLQVQQWVAQWTPE